MGSTPFQQVLPDAIARAENLPTLPAVALEVLDLARDDNAGLEDYSRVLSHDPAIAARLLRLANSSMFSLGQEVTSIERATVVLGSKTIQLMAVSFSLVGKLSGSNAAPGFDHAEYWGRSLSCAVAGRELGRLLQFTIADESFLCGLLSDIGRLVIAECLPEAYAEVQARGEGWPTLAQEREILGFDHADVGGALLQAWKLPAVLSTAVAFCGRPDELPADVDSVTRDLVRIVHIAQLLVAVLREEEKGTYLRELHRASEAAGLSRQQIDTVILALESRIGETAEMLEIDVGASSHYDILEQARRQALAIASERRTTSDERRSLRNGASAVSDERTGLGNRAFLDEVLDGELRNRMYGNAADDLGLLLVEIHGLDELRERHGESGCDGFLEAVGLTLRGLARASDAPGRFEPTVFGIVVPACVTEGQERLGERIVEACHEIRIAIGRRTPGLSVCVGSSTLATVSSLDDGERLVKAARDALRRAIQKGPGAVEVDRI